MNIFLSDAHNNYGLERNCFIFHVIVLVLMKIRIWGAGASAGAKVCLFPWVVATKKVILDSQFELKELDVSKWLIWFRTLVIFSAYVFMLCSLSKKEKQQTKFLYFYRGRGVVHFEFEFISYPQ